MSGATVTSVARLQKPYEDCDDKNNANGDGCSAACKKEVSVPK